MKIKSLFVVISFVLVNMLASCTKTNDTAWFTKNETYCAEAWHNEPWLGDQQEENAKMWLEMQGITVLATEYNPEGTDFEACFACTCLSGGVYRVQINIEFTDMMLEENFILE